MDEVMLFMQGLTVGLPMGFIIGIMLFTWDNRKPTRVERTPEAVAVNG